ncbi:MAG: hypothetical protein HY695_03470 [Deltaproteobacteria bacterium]|nr:hypothetical protein [Deltaproteobacteria bacterium]
METEVVVILALVIGILLAVGVWFYMTNRKSKSLKKTFGPEYERLVRERGNRNRAEAELQSRVKRVEQLRIVRLSPSDAARFSDGWSKIQGRFVDNPKQAVEEADRHVRDLMQARGYPMSDFEQRAADISVHHPTVVENYRAARNIAIRNQRGDADTEELRKALVYYRALFNELLEIRRPEKAA